VGWTSLRGAGALAAGTTRGGGFWTLMPGSTDLLDGLHAAGWTAAALTVAGGLIALALPTLRPAPVLEGAEQPAGRSSGE
jgi:hypothetical protein